MMQWLRDDLKPLLNVEKPFTVASNLQGQVFRQVANRKTFRFCYQQKQYFIKLHFATGWREIIKNIAELKLPIVSALNEYAAIRHCEQHGINTMTVAGVYKQGINPATCRSFLITDELREMLDLETLAANWHIYIDCFKTKRRLIRAVAKITAAMFDSGMNHRDFYICHLMLKQDSLHDEIPALYLIDLHRAQIRKKVPRRWLIKDLAGLYFSTMDLPLTRHDYWYFLKEFTSKPAKHAFCNQAGFWKRVHQKAIALYEKESRKRNVSTQ
jgi:heptose I phosphotransferase